MADGTLDGSSDGTWCLQWYPWPTALLMVHLMVRMADGEPDDAFQMGPDGEKTIP